MLVRESKEIKLYRKNNLRAHLERQTIRKNFAQVGRSRLKNPQPGAEKSCGRADGVAIRLFSAAGAKARRAQKIVNAGSGEGIYI
jgi:hypothetical protein